MRLYSTKYVVPSNLLENPSLVVLKVIHMDPRGSITISPVFTSLYEKIEGPRQTDGVQDRNLMFDEYPSFLILRSSFKE